MSGQPGNALDVEVVGGFVEDDDVGAAGEDRSQGDAAALANRRYFETRFSEPKTEQNKEKQG